jgi:hypothetical protein
MRTEKIKGQTREMSMWPILITEIEYNRISIVYVFVVSAIGYLLLHFWPALFGSPPNKNVGYISICYMYSNFVMAMLILPWAKEKRGRLLSILPVPIRNIDLAHLALFIIYWLEILLLYLIFVALSPNYYLDSATCIALLAQTGVVFIVYALIGILNVFSDTVWRKIAEIAVLLLFAFIAVAGIVHSYQRIEDVHVVDRILSWAYRSSTGPLILFFAGVGLVLLFLFYPWRKSYAAC